MGSPEQVYPNQNPQKQNIMPQGYLYAPAGLKLAVPVVLQWGLQICLQSIRENIREWSVHKVWRELILLNCLNSLVGCGSFPQIFQHVNTP